jgi:hypothetical protein
MDNINTQTTSHLYHLQQAQPIIYLGMPLLHKTKQQYNYYLGNKVGISAVFFVPLRYTKGCRLKQSSLNSNEK